MTPTVLSGHHNRIWPMVVHGWICLYVIDPGICYWPRQSTKPGSFYAKHNSQNNRDVFGVFQHGVNMSPLAYLRALPVQRFRCWVTETHYPHIHLSHVLSFACHLAPFLTTHRSVTVYILHQELYIYAIRHRRSKH